MSADVWILPKYWLFLLIWCMASRLFQWLQILVNKAYPFFSRYGYLHFIFWYISIQTNKYSFSPCVKFTHLPLSPIPILFLPGTIQVWGCPLLLNYNFPVSQGWPGVSGQVHSRRCEDPPPLPPPPPPPGQNKFTFHKGITTQELLPFVRFYCSTYLETDWLLK